MQEQPRYTEMIGLKVSPEQAAEIRRQARADDRTVSGYLRRLIAAAFEQRQARSEPADER